jgi:hypothetical protein
VRSASVQDLPFRHAKAILPRIGGCRRMEATMGDKSPKSKQRDQKQKVAAKQANATNAKDKQDKQAQQFAGKGKK